MITNGRNTTPINTCNSFLCTPDLIIKNKNSFLHKFWIAIHMNVKQGRLTHFESITLKFFLFPPIEKGLSYFRGSNLMYKSFFLNKKSLV